MSISLADVAKRAGVSSGTVSQTLNGNKAARISAKTQEKIRLIAAEMNYQPNSYARNIARRKTSTLRLITSSHDNQFFVEVAKSVDYHTREAGYKLLVDSTLDERPRYKPGQEVGIWPVDGALIWATHDQWLEMLLGGQANEIPVVYLGYQGPGPVDAVTTDHYLGGRLAAEHMVERGYRKIAYLSPLMTHEDTLRDSRMRAYADVCRETGRVPEQIYFVDNGHENICLLSLKAGEEIAARPAKQRPDAIICFNDSIAAGLLHGVRRGGLRVPQDLAIIGFDGSLLSKCLDLPLTTVAIPVESICKAGVDLLISRIDGDRATPPKMLVLPNELVIGGTT